MILRNIIDYYRETWNKTEKPYYHSKEMCQKLKISTSDYSLAKRNTKSQKMKIQLSNGDIEINKRKAHKLVQIVFLVKDKLLKLFLLQKLIYFNYEFMHANAILKNMSFTLDTGKLVKKLHEKFSNRKKNPFNDLLKISEIYQENFHLINKYPNSLGHQVLCRMNKSSLLNDFINDSMQYCPLDFNYLYTFERKILFKPTENAAYIDKLFWNYKCDYLFALKLIDDKIEQEVALIDMINKNKASNVINNWFLPAGASKLQILFDNSENACKTVFFYVHDSAMCIKTTEDEHIAIIGNINENSVDLKILSSQCLLIRNENQVIIYDFIEHNIIYEKEFTNVNIHFTETNISNDVVYSTDFEKIKTTFILVGLDEKNVWVCRFNKSINLVNWSGMLNVQYYEFAKPVIDKMFCVDYVIKNNLNLIDSTENDKNTVIIRFAILDFFINVVQVFSNKSFIMSQINEEALDLGGELVDRYFLCDFLDNNITFKVVMQSMFFDNIDEQKNRNGNGNVYIFNIGNIFSLLKEYIFFFIILLQNLTKKIFFFFLS